MADRLVVNASPLILLGRRCAASIGESSIGTLGLVLRSKARGLIDEARGLREELRRAGLYLTEETAEKALTVKKK